MSKAKLGGVECLSGIPGSVGGTPVQNVGAYGQETADTLVSVRALDRASRIGRRTHSRAVRFRIPDKHFQHDGAGPLYRSPGDLFASEKWHSLVKYPDLQRSLEESTRPPTLAEVRNAVREIRASKGMLIVEGDPDCRSAGSFFKNPIITEAEYARIQSATAVKFPAIRRPMAM